MEARRTTEAVEEGATEAHRMEASSMESPDGGTRPTGATEMALLDRPHDRRAVSFGPTA